MQNDNGSLSEGLRLLQEIGDLLDGGRQPYVHENGLVTPGPDRPDTVPGMDMDKEKRNASQPEAGSEGPTAGQGQGAAAGRSAAACAESLVLGHTGLTDELRRDLGAAITAYPAARVVIAPPVVWLLTPVHPIYGLPDGAYLLTRIPMDESSRIASWAWWDLGIWIGPRHTNTPDGSICAFERKDGTWSPEKGLTLWLDLHATWITRQLYLRYFNRWPGSQVLHTALERLRDHMPNELCGCRSGDVYEVCCRKRDLATSPYERLMAFRRQFGNGCRRPDQDAAGQLQSLITGF